MQNINLQWSIFTAAAAAALDQERSMKVNDHEWMNEWKHEGFLYCSTSTMSERAAPPCGRVALLQQEAVFTVAR